MLNLQGGRRLSWKKFVRRLIDGRRSTTRPIAQRAERHAACLALGLQPGDHVLDLACGTGLNFTHLRELVGTQGHVVGVDLSPRMLAIARQLVATHGWQNVKAHTADAAQLPFPDESFHKAICSFALNIIPDYVQAIKEVRRVLVPGGRFVALNAFGYSHRCPTGSSRCRISVQ